MNYHLAILIAGAAPSALHEIGVLTPDQTVMIYLMMIIGIILAIHETLTSIDTKTNTDTN